MSGTTTDPCPAGTVSEAGRPQEPLSRRRVVLVFGGLVLALLMAVLER